MHIWYPRRSLPKVLTSPKRVCLIYYFRRQMRARHFRTRLANNGAYCIKGATVLYLLFVQWGKLLRGSLWWRFAVGVSFDPKWALNYARVRIEFSLIIDGFKTLRGNLWNVFEYFPGREAICLSFMRNLGVAYERWNVARGFRWLKMKFSYCQFFMMMFSKLCFYTQI